MDDHLLRFAKNKKFTFIDCETFNLCLNEFNNLPWQIAMIETLGGETITEKHDLYLDWDTHLKISEEAKKITKFSDYKFNSRKSPSEQCVIKTHEVLKSSDYIVGHNLLGFDIYLLRIAFQKFNLDWKFMMPKILDTFALMKGVRLESKYKSGSDLLAYQYKQIHTIKSKIKCSLGVLGKEFDIDHDHNSLHDALVDLELNLKFWNKLKYMIEV
jgi:DNA polymerase III epsilon subunit-like protein